MGLNGSSLFSKQSSQHPVLTRAAPVPTSLIPRLTLGKFRVELLSQLLEAPVLLEQPSRRAAFFFP